MARTNRARAPQGAVGTCRNRRRPQSGDRRAGIRPLRRAALAIRTSSRLILSSVSRACAAEQCAERRPVQASRRLHAASGRLVDASRRLYEAACNLARANECIGRNPENAAGVPEMLIEVTWSWIAVSGMLGEASNDVFGRHENLIGLIENGTLVPERRPERRPRIRLAPRPPSLLRAFLQARQPRVVDRIASLLRRRRRTPRPAAVRVPRRSILGRAPPLSPLCLL